MKNFLIILLLLITLPASKSFADNRYIYILNDQCIERLHKDASIFFKDTGIIAIKDARGIILRYKLNNIKEDFYNPNINSYKKIESFLAKIENPVIIEVHVGSFSEPKYSNLKNWELSTIIANSIEAIITLPSGTINKNRILSVGYGEFLPAKNTSNNGGKNSDRVDIIILCNINGE